MSTVALLRHAKSSWDDPRLADHERPLTKRGARDAARIGALLAADGLVPELIVCSTALRARATATLLLAQLARPGPPIEYDDALYMAEPGALLARIASVGPAIGCAMIVGHNPGLHALALALTGAGDRRDLERLALGYPTAALAVVDFETELDGVSPGQGRLRVFVTPKMLG